MIIVANSAVQKDKYLCYRHKANPYLFCVSSRKKKQFIVEYGISEKFEMAAKLLYI